MTLPRDHNRSQLHTVDEFPTPTTWEEQLGKLLDEGEQVAARLARTTGDIRAALAFVELLRLEERAFLERLCLEVHGVSRVPPPTPGTPESSKPSE
jgi:hypothetical protein